MVLQSKSDTGQLVRDKIGYMLVVLLLLQCQARQAAGYLPASGPEPSRRLTRPQPVNPIAEAPGAEVEATAGYSTQALEDKIDELPEWGKVDFGLYSGYDAR